MKKITVFLAAYSSFIGAMQEEPSLAHELAQALTQFRNMMLAQTKLPFFEIMSYSEEVEKKLFKPQVAIDIFFNSLAHLQNNKPISLELQNTLIGYLTSPLQNGELTLEQQRELYVRFQSYIVLDALMSGYIPLEEEKNNQKTVTHIPWVGSPAAINQSNVANAGNAGNLYRDDGTLNPNSDGRLIWNDYINGKKNWNDTKVNTDNILIMQLSPRGEYVAAALASQSIVIWNYQTGTFIREYSHLHKSGNITYLAWHSNTNWIAWCTDDGRIEVIDINTNESSPIVIPLNSRYIKPTLNAITALSWCTDSHYLAHRELSPKQYSRSENKDTIVIYNDKSIFSQRPKFSLYDDFISGAVFMHNRRPYFIIHIPFSLYNSKKNHPLLGVSLPEDPWQTDTLVWDIFDQKLLKPQEYSERFGTNRKSDHLSAQSLVIYSYNYGAFHFPQPSFFDICLLIRFEENAPYDGEFKRLLPFSETASPLEEPVNKVQWIPASDTYITVNDTVLTITDSKTKDIKQTLTTDTRIIALSYCTDKIAISEENNQVTICDLKTNAWKKISLTHRSTFLKWVDDYLLIRTEFDTVAIYDSEARLIQTLHHDEYIHHIDTFRIWPDYKLTRVILASKNSLSIWDLSTGNLVHREYTQINDIISVPHQTQDHRILVGERTIRRIRIQFLTQEYLAKQPMYDSDSYEFTSPISVVSLPHYPTILVATDDGMLHIGHINDVRRYRSFQTHHSMPIYSVVGINGRIFATVALDNTIKIWTYEGMLLDTIITPYPLDIASYSNQSLRLQTPNYPAIGSHKYLYPYISLQQKDPHLGSTYLPRSYRALFSMFTILKFNFHDDHGRSELTTLEGAFAKIITPKYRSQVLQKLLEQFTDITSHQAAKKFLT